MLGYPCESIFDKQDHAAMIVLETILSGYGYPGGWLHNELRGAGLVYFVQAFELTGPVPGYFAILSQTQPDKIDEVVSRIRRNLAQAKEGKIPADEFRTALRQIVAMHAQENTTHCRAGPAGRPGRALRPGLRLRQDLRRPHRGRDAGRSDPRRPQVPGPQRSGHLLAPAAWGKGLGIGE